MVGLETVSAGHLAELREQGIEALVLPTRDLAAVAASLAQREVQSLLVEGGPVLQQAWADAGLVDAAQYVETPVYLRAGVPVAPALGQWVEGAVGSRRSLGVDVLVEGTWAVTCLPG
jgi:riboflavin biosynthesis pyrimidine reductase